MPLRDACSLAEAFGTAERSVTPKLAFAGWNGGKKVKRKSGSEKEGEGGERGRSNSSGNGLSSAKLRGWLVTLTHFADSNIADVSRARKASVVQT